jgi:hypothetical protein
MLLRPWTISGTDIRMMGVVLDDPIKYLREILRMDWV